MENPAPSFMSDGRPITMTAFMKQAQGLPSSNLFLWGVLLQTWFSMALALIPLILWWSYGTDADGTTYTAFLVTYVAAPRAMGVIGLMLLAVLSILSVCLIFYMNINSKMVQDQLENPIFLKGGTVGRRALGTLLSMHTLLRVLLGVCLVASTNGLFFFTMGVANAEPWLLWCTAVTYTAFVLPLALIFQVGLALRWWHSSRLRWHVETHGW